LILFNEAEENKLKEALKNQYQIYNNNKFKVYLSYNNRILKENISF